MCNVKVTKVRLFIPAGAAAATPPFGPILGQFGINTVQFCKDFNDATDGLNLYFNDNISDSLGGFVLVVDIYINEDRTYKYVLNKPPVSFLLRLLTGVKTGAPRETVGVLASKEVVYVAQFKFPSMRLLSACNMVVGVARSIGIKIVR